MLKGVSTITDIHNNSDNTEVELVSLITEQIPKYKLRANSIAGYDKCDWLQTPVLPPDTNVDLSPELCEETFKFFILGGDRLSQMTRTYHDIEAVTQLLEEKERDLELAARIGQSLLEKNREAANRQERLEEELARVVEEASQLRHEISLKEDLLHLYVDDDTDSSNAPSPVKELRGIGRAGMYSHVEALQKKIVYLEKDNHTLKQEHDELQAQTEDMETEEQQLVTNTVKELERLHTELRESREQIDYLTEELQIRSEEAARQQEEITRLLSQLVDMQRKHKVLALENEELQQHLSAANNSQYELTKEVKSLEDRYDEVMMILDETREEARGLRDNPNHPVTFGDSLAAELEMSGVSVSAVKTNQTTVLTNDGLHANTKSRRPSSQHERIMNVAKYVNSLTNVSTSSLQPMNTPRKQNRPITTPMQLPYPRAGLMSPDSTPSSGLATPSLGRPGIPGTADLERAIRKLAMRRESARYMEESRYRNLKCESEFLNHSDGTVSPMSSIQSAGATPPPSRPTSPTRKDIHFHRLARFSKTGPLPKLRIIKLLEGSETLKHWKSLASCKHLLSSLDHPSTLPNGVVMRGYASLNGVSQIETTNAVTTSCTVKCSTAQTNMTDIPSYPSTNQPWMQDNPGKVFGSTLTQYTYTNCKINNPKDDSTSLTPSCSTNERSSSPEITSSIYSNLKSETKEEQESAARNFFNENTRTCSTTLGLAHLFKEYGVAPDEEVEVSKSNTVEVKAEIEAKSTKPTKCHMIWNRKLERTFLLPSIPAQNELNLNRRGNKTNPDTPPNSPTNKSSMIFPITKVISKPAKVELQSFKKENNIQHFSPNLLSKLKKLGLANVTIPASNGNISRCQTSPASLNQTWRDHFKTEHRRPVEKSPEMNKKKTEFVKPRTLSLANEIKVNDEISSRPLAFDWSDLHGSSKENLTSDECRVTIPYQSGITSTTNSLSQGSVSELDTDFDAPLPINTSTPEDHATEKQQQSVRPKQNEVKDMSKQKVTSAAVEMRTTPRASRQKLKGMRPKKL